MSELNIDLSEEGFVEIRPDSEMPVERWMQVVTVWSKTDSASLRSRVIRVDISEFVNRMGWLKDVWRARGESVNVSESVVNEVRSARQGKLEFERLLHSNPDQSLDDEFLVPGLKRQLTSHQARNSRLIRSMKSGANFSVPGAGKTMTALVVWKSLRAEESVDKLLVVCPRSAFSSWKQEANEVFETPLTVDVFDGKPVDLDADIIITNYEQIESTQKLEYLTSWASRNKVHLVIDEAHRVKAGGRSVRWRACRKLASVANRVDLLTGTPMPQDVDDLAALYKLAWPTLPSNYLNNRLLASMRRNTTFVRTTKAELDLPKMIIEPVRDEPDNLQAEIYSALRDQYAGVFDVSNQESAFLARRGRAVMSLLAAATNPGLLLAPSFQELALGIQWPPNELQSNHRLVELSQRYLQFEMPWKFKFVAKRVEELAAKGQKVIVWSSFVGNLMALQRVLEKFSPALVFGGVTADDRDSEISRFRSDTACSVLLTNPQTLGEGISLHHECHEAIYVDRTFNAGLYLQSLDRIHRLGLPKNVVTRVTVLETKNTIDIRVGNRLDWKINRLATFLDDPGLVASSIPQGDEIRPEDLLGMDSADFDDVFGHLK
jgi:SNF2 family DNA or RNA helicase